MRYIVSFIDGGKALYDVKDHDTLYKLLSDESGEQRFVRKEVVSVTNIDNEYFPTQLKQKMLNDFIY